MYYINMHMYICVVNLQKVDLRELSHYGIYLLQMHEQAYIYIYIYI